MWLLALYGSALAAPPDGVDPNDLDRWESSASALLAGPGGCWEIEGRVDLVMAAYTPATLWTRAERSDHRFTGSFSGRLDQGTWTRLDYDLVNADKPEKPAEMEVPLFPSVGKIAPNTSRRTNPSDQKSSVSFGSDEEAVHLFTELLDEIDPEAATSYGEWDEANRSIKLIQDVPIKDTPRSETIAVTTLFPEGGVATSMDAIFPTRIRVGEGLVKVTLFDGQLHLRSQKAGDVVLPALESLSFGFGALGFTIGYEQKLTYTRATPCS